MSRAGKPPWQKALTEPRKLLFYSLFYMRRLAPSRGDLYAAPTAPSRSHLAWRVAEWCGLRVVRKPTSNVRIAQCFDEATSFQEPSAALLPPSIRFLNLGCTDVSKARVETIHAQVFGYGMSVDPIRHRGAMVVKSTLNAAHDGRIVEGPLTRVDEGSVYQLVIDNDVDEMEGRRVDVPMVLDLRVMIVGDEIPVAYRKYRRKADRFQNHNVFARWYEPDALFNADELRLLAQFARAMGLDFGEIDVLRDRQSGRIYAIDVNPTPHSPPALLEGPIAAYPIMRRAGRAFERQFMQAR